jgi:AmiR/NasT family two-component response regulator
LRIRAAVQDGNTIGRAVGILMAAGGIDAASARDLLHRDADHRGVPILLIAREVVERYPGT